MVYSRSAGMSRCCGLLLIVAPIFSQVFTHRQFSGLADDLAGRPYNFHFRAKISLVDALYGPKLLLLFRQPRLNFRLPQRQIDFFVEVGFV